MKIRQKPEDFSVTELSRYELTSQGPFALYRLLKWDIGTIEAIRNLTHAWKLPRAAVSFGGLKDRHARTEQVLSIRGGPGRNFDGSAFRVEYLGRSRDPITRSSFSGNRFAIVARDVDGLPDLEALKRWGVANYFDDQRFGSLRGTEGEFIGRALVRGEYEKALRLAIASPSGEDRKQAREIKTLVRDRWGDWKGLRDALPRGVERAVAAYLADRPGAWGFAFERLDPDLRILYVSAYQSWLWNRTLAELVKALPDVFEVEYAAGRHAFWRTLSPEDHDRLAELAIPLITPSQKFAGPVGEITARILAEEKVEPRQFRLKKLEQTFFGKGLREAILAPAGLKAVEADDDLNRGRKKVTLSFELPRGAYATVVLKRLFHAPANLGADEEF